MSDSTEYVIETTALSKRYGRKLALDHLDLRIPRGRIHAVVEAARTGELVQTGVLSRPAA